MFCKRRAFKVVLSIIGLLQIGSASALPTTTSDNVNFDCVFTVTLDGHALKYDLCPLLRRGKYRVSRDVETPPSITRIHYDISLSDYIPLDGTLPTRDQCEQGTNICMTVISERPDHRLEPPRTIYVVPVAGNFPDRQLNVTAKLAEKADSMNHGTPTAYVFSLPLTLCTAPLKLTFHGGRYMNIPQKSAWVILIFGVIVIGNLRRRWSVRHDTSRYRSFALSRVSPAIHHEADPRSPLSPHTPDAHHTRKYTAVN
ncbi:hypothetical protein RSAG8_10113, partial [Rhizoctonia solani AG-8 WAC10335]